MEEPTIRMNKDADGKIVYHTRVPVNQYNRFLFIPNEILDAKSDEDRKAFIAVGLQKVVADLMALDVMPHVIVQEKRTQHQQGDKIVEGIEYAVSIIIGQPPIVAPPKRDEQLITVPNN